MNKCEFYRVVIGLQGQWEVTAVEVGAEQKKVEVKVGYKKGTLWGCPDTHERLPVLDHVERRWRHLDTWGESESENFHSSRCLLQVHILFSIAGGY